MLLTCLVPAAARRATTTRRLPGVSSLGEPQQEDAAELFADVRGEEEEASLKQFLLTFTVLPVTQKVAQLGGLYRREYRASHGMGIADALIAATAEDSGAGLVSFNRRRCPMAEITVPYERE